MKKLLPPSPPNPHESATEAGLRYIHPDMPGFTRRKFGKGFVYQNSQGNKITHKPTLERIQALRIPPAYRDVWVCPLANGHLQATGQDERGRTQYLYHPKWREVRDATKFHRMKEFGLALPKIRSHLQKDLQLPGLPRHKILAAIVKILDKTAIRIGNEEYAKDNHSYGLTTLHNKHAQVKGADIHFSFRGKRGIEHSLTLHDPKLAKIIRECQDLPGYELFEYKSGTGQVRQVSSNDVNEYLKQITKEDFTAKDFRTWHATTAALKCLLACPPSLTKKDIQQNISATVKKVAEHLGNTPAICRKSYIHPTLLQNYAKGCLAQKLKKTYPKKYNKQSGLRQEEKQALLFLENCQE